jgi:hypothetical protein
MARFLTTAPLLVGLVFMAACGRDDDTYDTEEALETTPAVDSPATPAVERTVMFVPGTPGTAGENVTGTVRVREDGAIGTQLEIELMGLPEGEHTVVVVDGACAPDAAPEATDPAAAPVDPAATTATQDRTTVRAGADGRATGTLNLSGDRYSQGQLSAGQFSVRVLSGTAEDVTAAPIACANLNDQGLGGIR